MNTPNMNINPVNINTSCAPIFLSNTLTTDIWSTLNDLSRRNANRWSERELQSDTLKLHRRATEIFSASNISPTADPCDFLNALCKFSGGSSDRNRRELLDRIYKFTTSSERLPATGLPWLRQNARYILFNLWKKGSIILPITFSLQKALSRHEQSNMSSELYHFCLTFINKTEINSTQFRINQHVSRWLICTKWHAPEDITMQDALVLNRFLLDCGSGLVQFEAPAIATSVRIFLAEIHVQFPNRVSFNTDDLKSFDAYFAKNLGSDIPFIDIGMTVDKIDEARRVARKQINKTRIYQKPRGKESIEDEIGGPDYIVYKQKYSRNGWFPDILSLSYLSKTLSRESQNLWGQLFDRYIFYRVNVKGFESQDSTNGALRCLADYLGLCIPVLLHERRLNHTIPACPKEFTRYPYIDDRGKTDGIDTLPSYVGKRYGKDGTYSILNQIRMFFEFILVNYGDEECLEIAGPTFRNPIAQEFDLPRMQGSKSRRTNKRPFGKFVVPHLLSWFYAIEDFGMFIQRTNQRVSPRSGTTLTSDYGYMPVYYHLGCVYALESVPTHLVSPQLGYTSPSLTMLRLLITTLETGLRFQGTQWLCRKTFDSLNLNRINTDFFMLLVNTDKTNNGFSRPIMPRVREMMLREKSDQEAYGVADVMIYYENRPHTRFEKLVPLFRNVKLNQPYTDGGYSNAWALALQSFQEFFSPIGGIHFIKRTGGPKSITKRSSDGYQYTPLHIRAIYTPHSCRSTFVTRRSPFIELGDIAKLIGHSGPVVTSHYDAPEFESLFRKLQYADRAIAEENEDIARITSVTGIYQGQGCQQCIGDQFQLKPHRDDPIVRYDGFASGHRLDQGRFIWPCSIACHTNVTDCFPGDAHLPGWGALSA